MKKKLHIIWIVYILNITIGFSQETFNVMFYNLLNFPLEDAVPNRLNDLETILSDYKPDIFMVCELNNEEGANTILQLIQDRVNPNFEMAVFQPNTSDDEIGNQNDLQNLVFYDASKFILENQTIVTTIFRDFNHYELKLNSVNQDTNPVVLHTIVCHLKASSGTENQALRLQMAQDLTAYLNTLPSAIHMILAGDFNVYTNSEGAFQEFINSQNNIPFNDPENRIGSWHNNSNYVDVFTQSTRTQTGMGGTTGGFDDRFDFIMTSNNLMTDDNLNYVNGSYKVYGNNGNSNCFNQAINDIECSGSDFSFSIRDALHNFSDHLPVTIQIQTDQALLNVNEFVYSSGIEIVGSNIINDNLIVRIDNNIINIEELSIYNTIGQKVKTIKLFNSNLINIPCERLSNGIYYLSASKSISNPIKFVKVN
ncbi:endonuclease/exonuclease/phosphatase family protein [Hanstruepera marina]|uniref:endonuclease/exonuclease/phosphatase family protein n=1 Tax=Hanstruepera marina TaxID=2873265 RepID=UPI001CA72BC7|nr:endonuclease/exonuclease/phosphatase family protein [Hanstruepera marina]